MLSRRFSGFSRFSTAIFRSRTVAESNASLLEAFSQIIENPKNGGGTLARQPSSMLKTANSLEPAPEFDGPTPVGTDRVPLVSEFGGVRFKPGDVYLPQDLVMTAKMKPDADPFVVVRKHVDIFRRNKIDLSRIHMNVSFLDSCISPLGKIYGRNKTGLSSKSQRHIARAIKRARHMGLIPYMHRSTV